MSQIDDGVVVIHDGHIARIELCRPPHNFLDAALLDALADRFERLDQDANTRCIVLAAQGKAFCAGADFSREEGNVETAQRFYRAAARLFACRKPVIAAIHGATIGAGLGLALVADFRIATPQARFSANFARLGIHPGFGISLTLPRLVGQQSAAMMLYTGRRIGGEEALHIGLADGLVGAADLHHRVTTLAREIAESAPLAVVATRTTLRGKLTEEVVARMAHEASEQARLFTTADYLEGLRAVTERRTGNFSGR